MADNTLQVTAIYTDGDTVVKETATTNDTTSFKVIDLEGPFDDNGNLLQYVEEGQVYVYIVTLDKDVSVIDVKKINWAMAYDENGLGAFKLEKIQGGRPYTTDGSTNKIWVYLQSEKATSLLTIHAYTGSLPVNGSSITVSVDHVQYEADLKKGNRCNTPSNVTIVTNDTTEVEDKDFELELGIRLHFLRYGFFIGNDHADHNAIGRYEIKDHKSYLTPYNKYSNVENFHCHLTELVSGGFIYVIDPKRTKPDDAFEYYVTPGQKLRRIPWYVDPEKEDIRSTFGAIKAGKNVTEHYYHLVEYIEDKEETPELYICYSPVQWSKAYYEKMLSDTALRKERMTKVLCTGFSDSETDNGNEQYAYDGFSAAFTEDNKIGANRLKRKKKYLANSQAKKIGEDAELKLDMFIPLLDPVNAAREIADEVAHHMLNFKALVEAIQTGETQEEAYNRICFGRDTPKPDKEFYAMYSLALTSYHFIYNNNRKVENTAYSSEGPYVFYTNSNDLANYVDKAKIEGILGVEARNKLRGQVNKLRDDLGNFLSHDDFKIPLDDYLYNHVERQVEGRTMFSELLDALFITTYEFDRHLLLKKDYKTNDKWQTEIFKITDYDLASDYNSGKKASKAPDFMGIDPLYALITPLINIDKVLTNADKIGRKIGKALGSRIKYEAKRYYTNLKSVNGTYHNAGFAEVIVKKCNQNLKVYNNKLFEVHTLELKKVLKANGIIFDAEAAPTGPYRGKKPVTRFYKKDIKVVKIKRAKYALNVPILEEVNQAKATSQMKFDKIANSKGFTGVMAILDVYNFATTVSNLNDSTKKGKLNFASATLSLVQSGTSFLKAMGHTTALEKTVSFGRLSASRIQILGGVSSGVTAVLCFWDAYDANIAGDTDAATAYVLAGVTYGIAAGAGLYAFYSGAALAGPLGWITAIAATGFYVIAIMLTDTPLEQYFKNFVLSDRNKKLLIKANESPMAYNRRLINNKQQLVLQKFQKNMMHPQDAQAMLMNLVVCPMVEVEATKTESKVLPSYGAIPVTMLELKAFKVRMRFYKFLNQAGNLDIKVYYFRTGLKVQIGNPDTIIPKIQQIKDDNGTDMLEVFVDLDDRETFAHTQLIIAIRLYIGGENLYFPYNNREGQARYLAIMPDIRNKYGITLGHDANLAPKFLTKEELFKSNSW